MKENVKKGLNKIKEEQKRVSREVLGKTVGYILAALGFVVALAWNDAIRTSIEYLFPLNKNSILAKFVYALLVTVLIVIVTIIFTRKTEAPENKK